MLFLPLIYGQQHALGSVLASPALLQLCLRFVLEQFFSAFLLTFLVALLAIYLVEHVDPLAKIFKKSGG